MGLSQKFILYEISPFILYEIDFSHLRRVATVVLSFLFLSIFLTTGYTTGANLMTVLKTSFIFNVINLL